MAHLNHRMGHLPFILILPGLLFLCVSGQTRRSPPQTESQIRQLLLSQPDYTATQQFGFIEARGGFGATSKVAKLGSRYREEDDDRILIREPGKPTIRIYPKRREFSEMSEADSDSASESFPLTPEQLARSQVANFRLSGRKRVGRYECQNIEVTYRDARLKDLKFVFCSAPALKNLIVFKQTFLGAVTMTTVLTNVSLAVSDHLFRIPTGYKRVNEKDYEEQLKDLLNGIKQATPSP